MIRDHNGDIEVLNNVGDDPDSVTFMTDKFSSYAIAYEAVNINSLVLRFLIIALISLILTILCVVNLYVHARRARKARHGK